MQVRHIGVSNETSYGVMRFVQLAEQLGLPKIVSIQNSYSLLVHSPLLANSKNPSDSKVIFSETTGLCAHSTRAQCTEGRRSGYPASFEH